VQKIADTKQEIKDFMAEAQQFEMRLNTLREEQKSLSNRQCERRRLSQKVEMKKEE
jgi:hypothetical protein